MRHLPKQSQINRNEKIDAHVHTIDRYPIEMQGFVVEHLPHSLCCSTRESITAQNEKSEEEHDEVERGHSERSLNNIYLYMRPLQKRFYYAPYFQLILNQFIHVIYRQKAKHNKPNALSTVCK